MDSLSSLLIPFRQQPPPLRLPEGYALEVEGLTGSDAEAEALDRLLAACGERLRGRELWARVLERSAWHLLVRDPAGQAVGFLRATSDQALNANLWDLLSDPADPARQQVIRALVQVALARLRRELGGCSISLSAPPEAVEALVQAGFLVDPGGIRAMGLRLAEPTKPTDSGAQIQEHKKAPLAESG